jgi:hypothetical protein
MQLNSWQFYAKSAALAGLACAILAGAATLLLPKRYISSAELRIVPSGDGGPAQVAKMALRMEELSTEILARRSLAALVQDESLALYQQERGRVPVEDIVDQLRKQDLQTQWVNTSLPREGPGPALRVSFAYSDPRKAQAALLHVVSAYAEKARSTPDALTLEVVSAPNSPQHAERSNRTVFLAWGLGLGLLVGLLVASFRRRPKWSLRLVEFALAGAAVTSGAALLIHDQYVSTALMRLVPVDGSVLPVVWMHRLTGEVLSMESLVPFVKQPGFDLYRRDRYRHPPNELAAQVLARNIHTELVESPLSEALPELRISFSYPEASIAQQGVRELVGKFNETRYRMSQEQKGTPVLELMESANLPQEPASPNRIAIALAGLAAGAAAGAWPLRKAELRRTHS